MVHAYASCTCNRIIKYMHKVNVSSKQLHYSDVIWRNGPYIGGHLAFFFLIEFQTRLQFTINRTDCESVL